MLQIVIPAYICFSAFCEAGDQKGPIFTVGACFEKQAASLHILYLNPNLVLYIAYARPFG